MNTNFKKAAGYSLIIGSILMVLTMVLHPSGGNVTHIMETNDTIIISHAIAIFSLPFIAFGFYGLTSLLLNDSKVSFLAFCFALFALIAGMLAAAINGLVLPMFVEKYFNEFEQNKNTLNPIIRYGFMLNKSMDYILLTGILISILMWSVLIIRGNNIPKWVGYYGMILCILALFGAIIGFDFIYLAGFRIIILCVAGWVILAGWVMRKKI